MAVKSNSADAGSPDLIIKSPDGLTTLVQAKKRKRARVKVGGVYVSGDKATAAEVKNAVAKSTEALVRLANTISKPGVRLYAGRNVPLYSADPDHPDRVVRKLNGRTERGVLENGAFKALD